MKKLAFFRYFEVFYRPKTAQIRGIVVFSQSNLMIAE